MTINLHLTGFIRGTLKNSISISLSRVLVSVSLFILTFLVARKLGPGELGGFSIALSLFAIFELISYLGLDNLLIREISKEESRVGVFFYHGIVLGVISTSICLVALIVTGIFLRYPWEVQRLIYAVGLLLLPYFLNFLSETICIALQKAQFVLYTALVREASMFILSIIFLAAGRNVLYVIAAIFLSRCIGLFVFGYFFYRIKVKPVLRLDNIFIKKLLRMLPVFVFISIISSLFWEIDIIILSKIVTVSEVGIYSIAKKFVRANFILLYGVATALFPVISYAFASSKEQFKRLYALSTRYIFLLSALIVLAMLWCIPIFIRAFLGSRFIDSIPIAKILVWSIIPWSLSFLLSRFLIAGGRQDKDLLALCIGLVSLSILGIALSYKSGAVGMGLANVISLIILVCMHYLFVKKYVMRPQR